MPSCCMPHPAVKQTMVFLKVSPERLAIEPKALSVNPECFIDLSGSNVDQIYRCKKFSAGRVSNSTRLYDRCGTFTCRSRLAGDGGFSGDNAVDYQIAIASKPAPTVDRIEPGGNGVTDATRSSRRGSGTPSVPVAPGLPALHR